MNKISCDTCLDLMPLVIDGISSQNSNKLVEDHVEECEECRSFYSEPRQVQTKDLEINNDKVLGNIKRKLYSFAVLILIIGSLIGANLSNSQNVFYTFLLMPFLGGLAYEAFGKRSYIGSGLVFIITFINQIINNYLVGYYTSLREIVIDSLLTSIQFIIFFFVGISILNLLKFSFFGGKVNEK